MLGLLLVAAAAVSLAVMATFVGVGRIIASRDPSIRDRLDLWALLPTDEGVQTEASQPQSASNRLASVLNRLISRQAFASAVATELARANMPWTVSEYLMLSAVSVGVLFLLTWVYSRQVLLAAIAGLIGWYLPGLLVRRRRDQRLRGFHDQLPNVLTLLVGTLRSGYGLTAALDTVAQQMPPPVSEEFGRVVREIGLGMSAVQALRNLVRRVRSDDLDLVVTAIAIQYEVGGNLAVILETISDTIRERVRLKAQLRTLTAQHRMTRSILTGLPVAMAVIIYLMNPEYMLAMFTPGPFLLIPIASLVFIVLGWILLGRISNIEI
jgi:tight adherence protein B